MPASSSRCSVPTARASLPCSTSFRAWSAPTVGLDPASRSDLLKLLLTMRTERQVAVLWATHLCDEVGDADRVIVLHHGKVLADTTPAKLKANAGAATIEEAFLAMTGDGA